MVLGVILYETLDLAYSVGKITFNGVYYTYNWYYGFTQEDLNNKIINDENKLKQAEDKIKDLERRLLLLEDKKEL